MDDMEDGIAILPGVGDGFVALSRTSKGKLFKKHILSVGDLHYPGIAGGKVKIDEKFLHQVVDNFDNKVCDIVQFPVANKDNQHTEDPRDNLGEVVDLTVEGGKLYAHIDVRKHVEDIGTTILGASAMLALNYTDSRTNTKAGPTLLHVAATNRPHVVDLEDFSEIIAASADGTAEKVFLTSITQEEKVMDLDELLTSLEADHGINVRELQTKVAEAEPALALSAKLHEILNSTDVLALSAGATGDDIIGAVTKLAEEKVELSAKYDGLLQERAEESARVEVKDLISAGRVLPKDEDAYVTLRLTNADLFNSIVPEKPIVTLSKEEGIEPTEDEQHEKTVEEEVARLAASDAAKDYIRS